MILLIIDIRFMPAPFTLYTGISSATIGRKNDMSLTIAMGEPMEDILSPFKKLSNRSHSFSALILSLSSLSSKPYCTIFTPQLGQFGLR
ncbi:hypothetical protein [Ruminococcus sp.]|uniref:hypothetical protein n=1 Tax=Ruminococcus sp. TaxID=41978 RepID=UPI003FF04DD5